MTGRSGSRTMPDSRYWMVVTSPDNFEATRKRRFTVQGVKSRHRAKAALMAPGDRICWYVTGVKGFVATATVRSAMFESAEPIWRSDGKNPDIYPWRVKIARDRVRPIAQAAPAEDLVPRLAFTRKWPRANWTLAFQG